MVEFFEVPQVWRDDIIPLIACAVVALGIIVLTIIMVGKEQKNEK